MLAVGNNGIVRGGKKDLSLEQFEMHVQNGVRFLIEHVSEDDNNNEIIACTLMRMVQDENNKDVAMMVDTASKIYVISFANLVAFRIESRRYNWNNDKTMLIEE
jgi:hypothetical protein